MVYIYILKCDNNKYYVGKTNYIDDRMNKHFKFGGSVWTKIYAPKKVIRIIENCDNFDEDKYTIMTMAKYGIDNVRGGSFSSLVLAKEEKLMAIKMIRSSKDCCFNCGNNGHFITKCKLNNLNKILKITYEKIINLCEKYSNELAQKLKINKLDVYIGIEEYIKILKLADNVIFKNIKENDIMSICKMNDYYETTKNIVNYINDNLRNKKN